MSPWDALEPGQRARFAFTIDHEEHEAFRRLSGDDSLVHTDDDFARAHGFDRRIAYGALVIARLSRMVGMHLPGPSGVSLSWEIHFHRPLYIGQEAVFEGEIARKSPATRTTKLRFEVTAGSETIASGTARSKILEGP